MIHIVGGSNRQVGRSLGINVEHLIIGRQDDSGSIAGKVHKLDFQLVDSIIEVGGSHCDCGNLEGGVCRRVHDGEAGIVQDLLAAVVLDHSHDHVFYIDQICFRQIGVAKCD